jgi:hypothetical protein
MEPESIEPLETLIAHATAGAATVSLEVLAGQLGLTLSRRRRVHLGRILKRRGWQRCQVTHKGKTVSYWEPAELDPDERALRKFLATRERATLGECCYELRWLPDPEAKARVKRWLIGYGWTLGVNEGVEYFRPAERGAP